MKALGYRKIALGILVIFIITSCSKDENDQPDILRHVTAEEFDQIITQGAGNLVDVRTRDEYNAGHIEGAVLIDFYLPEFRDEIDQLPKDVAIYVYCRSGSRSAQAIAIMQELEFREIINLQNGILSWIEAGYPLSTP